MVGGDARFSSRYSILQVLQDIYEERISGEELGNLKRTFDRVSEGDCGGLQ